jgi:hypothetical protein
MYSKEWTHSNIPKYSNALVDGDYQMLQLKEIMEFMLDYTIVRLQLTLCYLLDHNFMASVI